MTPGFVVRLRPAGPWRIGPDSGARDRVDRIYHSDSLYSAVCAAMLRLGALEEWLDATARAPGSSQVCLSSLFPYQADLMLAPPPATHWPPAGSSGKVRWKGARFAPLGLIARLLAGHPIPEDQWVIDGPSECALPVDRTQAIRSPFRVAVRSAAAVDRLGLAVEPHATACIEFNEGAGLWAAVAFSDDAARERWSPRLKSALHLLADSGFGGERSRGWGRSEAPEFTEGALPELLLPQYPAPPGSTNPSGWWLLSLFTPSASDSIDWSRGCYDTITRGGRVDSPAGSGLEKKQVRMVCEGSVIVARGTPAGAAADVAPEGFPHPVYRAGFALVIPVPTRGVA
jgi:CRISPR type III-A-associated RAMP protein Csm4